MLRKGLRCSGPVLRSEGLCAGRLLRAEHLLPEALQKGPKLPSVHL
jgi:hypothetical protein